MFGLKNLFANSKGIQYSSYVIVIALIIAAKLYPQPDSSPEKRELSEILSEFTLPAAPLVTTIDRVVDGDTVIAGGISYRLAMIDAPESDQPYGQEAASFLRGLVADTEIIIRAKNKDRYDRTIADASINGISIAEMMIENGYAWVYMPPTPQVANQLELLERKARAEGIGLWADPTPMRPSIYRKRQNAAHNQ